MHHVHQPNDVSMDGHNCALMAVSNHLVHTFRHTSTEDLLTARCQDETVHLQDRKEGACMHTACGRRAVQSQVRSLRNRWIVPDCHLLVFFQVLQDSSKLLHEWPAQSDRANGQRREGAHMASFDSAPNFAGRCSERADACDPSALLVYCINFVPAPATCQVS